MSETPRSRAIVVLGMHRSGTSAVTRLINLMGAELGSNLMVAMEGNNETGFWEHQDVVDVHEEVLAAVDRRWDDVRALPGELATRADLAPMRERLSEIVRRDFAAVPLWAVKDPRMCRLLPLWEPVFAAAQIDPAFLIVLRNPMEIARSLERRDGFALGKGLLLWLRHALEAERATRGCPRLFLRYETIVEDWATELTRIGAALGVAWPKQSAEVASEVAGFLRPQLRHFSIGDDAVLGDEHLSRWVREVHGALVDGVAHDDDALHRRLDAVSAELAAAETLFDPVVDSRLSMIAELHRRLRRLEIDVAERDTRIAERDSRIAERDSRIGERDLLLRERDDRVAERDTRIAERDARIGFLVASVHELRQDVSRHAVVIIDRELQIKNLRLAVEDARAERARIFRSSSWRLTRPLRAAGRMARGMTGFVRAVLANIRYRVHRPTLEPIKNIEREGAGFRLSGTVGHFRLGFGRVLPACRAIVSYRISGSSVLQPWLYQGGRATIDIAYAARLPFRRGEIRTIIDLPAGVSALSIDAVESDASFALNDLKIVEIGKTMLALFWLKTWATAALSDRASRAILFARLKDGLRRKGPQVLMQRLTGLSTSPAYDEWIDAYDTLTPADRASIAERVAAMKDPPLISVVMPCYNSPEKWLRRAIESVIEQLYPHWELCIADDASSAPHVRPVIEEYARRDSRIKTTFRTENGHIARATNSALALATGRYVALLDHDDEYRPHALYMVAVELAAHPDAEVIYSDEDKLDEQGRRFDPYFKTDFSPDLMLSHNYLAHLIVYSRTLIEKVGGFRVGFEGSQDYDLALRCLDASRPERVRHIPFILYHWRAIAGSVALSGDQKSYAHDAARRAIGEHLARIGVAGAQVVGEESGTMHRVSYSLPVDPPKVSIIVPTRDRVDLLAVCVTGLLEKTDYPDWELLIIDNGSIEPETHAFFERLKGDSRIRVIPYVHPFNYSAINNLGARHATGELLCLLNNDIEPISRDWLGEMVSHALRPGVGAVGAKLYYAHDAIQHAGVVTGIGGVAGHFEKHLPRKEFGYFRRPGLIQNFSAVTGACLVVRRAVFEDVGGLDEKDLTVAFNDVDFCLRLRARGYLNVWTPYAELYHYESASRGYEDSPEKITRFAAEETHMKRRWGKALLADPYYNPNLSLLHEQVRLAFPPRVVKPWKQAAAG